MIEIRDYQGVTHYVAEGAIARVTEAATSSQWHGIKSRVKLFDGSIIDAADTAENIAKKIAMQEGK